MMEHHVQCSDSWGNSKKRIAQPFSTAHQPQDTKEIRIYTKVFQFALHKFWKEKLIMDSDILPELFNPLSIQLR